MAYTTKEQVEKFLKRTLTSDEDATFDVMLSAVETYIDNFTGSTFGEVEATTRYYDTEGDCSDMIDIEPVQSVTKVSALNYDKTTSYDYTENVEYILEPLNETIKNQLINRFGHWGSHYQRVSITGKFTEYDYDGNKVPDDIQMVATRLVGGLFKQGADMIESGNIKAESLEGHHVTYTTPADGIQELAFADPYVTTVLKQRQQILIG